MRRTYNRAGGRHRGFRRAHPTRRAKRTPPPHGIHSLRETDSEPESGKAAQREAKEESGGGEAFAPPSSDSTETGTEVATAEEKQGLLAGITSRRIRLEEHPLQVEEPGLKVLVDTGADQHGRRLRNLQQLQRIQQPGMAKAKEEGQ